MAAGVQLVSLKSVHRPLACVGVAVAFAFLILTLYRDDLADTIDDFNLAENPNVARFDSHCSALFEGLEGPPEAGAPQKWELQRVVVLVSPGDVSATGAWPHGDSGGPVAWVCDPLALPRHWRLNKHVEFAAIDNKDGSPLQRSFDPELLPPMVNGEAGQGVELEYPCGLGQLTSVGFRQCAMLGRFLANVYGDLLGAAAEQGRLDVRSVDTRAALGSIAGILATALAAPRALHAFGHGSKIEIRVQPNASADHLHLEAPNLGDHIFARWCHQLPFPCPPRSYSRSNCVSLEEAAQQVRLEEVTSCKEQLGQAVAHSLFSEVARVLRAPQPMATMAMWMAQGPVLAAVLRLLLGPSICEEPLLARPPLASRLVLERWLEAEGTGVEWRVLWNGKEITQRIRGCALSGSQKVTPQLPGGCPEAALEASLNLQ